MTSDDDPRNHEPATKGDLGELRAEMFSIRDDLGGQIRGVGVQVERLSSDVRLIAESITTMHRDLTRDADAREARLSERIARLEDVARTHSAKFRELEGEMKRGFLGIDARLSALENEVAQLRRDFERRDAERLASLEARVTELEKRAGIAK